MNSMVSFFFRLHVFALKLIMITLFCNCPDHPYVGPGACSVTIKTEDMKQEKCDAYKMELTGMFEWVLEFFAVGTVRCKRKKNLTERNLTNLTETNIFSCGKLSHGEVSYGQKSAHGLND